MAVGCKNRANDLVGDWTSSGQTITLKADKTWSTVQGPMTLGGTYAFEDPTVKFTFGQDSIKHIQEMIDKNPAITAAAGGSAKIKEAMSALTKPFDGKLSEDGKTLTVTNPGTGQPSTLTKKE